MTVSEVKQKLAMMEMLQTEMGVQVFARLSMAMSVIIILLTLTCLMCALRSAEMDF